MKAHGINNLQDIHQRLVINLIAADFDTQAQMLKCVTIPFIGTEKVSRAFDEACRRQLADDPSELEDELVCPAIPTSA
ncbi:hypothetical protein [Pseudomonas sp. D2002]|uniref:hypothetical protein n=1 Tax=Pseudomonas sp. D2002 TaxID=2726980 RepID=UPI0035273DC6